MAETENYERQHLEIDSRYWKTHGGQMYTLARFGDYLAQREGYRSSDLRGLDALRFYLMQKHRWTPATVMAMSHEHLEFALLEEKAGWTLPPEAVL